MSLLKKLFLHIFISIYKFTNFPFTSSFFSAILKSNPFYISLYSLLTDKQQYLPIYQTYETYKEVHMELNADILFEALSKVYKVEAAGCPLSKLSLNLPEHYLGGGAVFKKNHVYITRTDQLPPSPELEGPALLICLGGSPSNWYFNSEFSLIIVQTTTDILTLFNTVQAIYRKYNEWADALDQILETTADIQEMIDISLPIFNNFLAVIDDQMNYLAYTKDMPDDTYNSFLPDYRGKVPIKLFKNLTKTQKTSTVQSDPDLIPPGTYVNSLFNGKVLVGIFTIFPLHHSLTKGELILASYLSDKIYSALSRHSKILGSNINTFQKLLSDLLRLLPVDRGALEHCLQQRGGELTDTFVCIKIKAFYEDTDISIEYICSIFEAAFDFCIAFEHESIIAVFIDLSRTSHKSIASLSETLEKITANLLLKAGISYPFNDLFKAYFYYRQACCAFEIGCSLNPDKTIFNFSDCLLSYMTVKCIGEFPLDVLYPPEILTLIEHDKSSSVKYLETLKIYLDCNLSITNTSKALDIHRSTLIARIKNISSILDGNLDDPDYRLLLNILLRAYQK